MTLAARCPSCGTVFRVVQDQLRVSDGWVRCGRCGEVFNAVQNLVDLEVDVALPRRPAEGQQPAGIDAPPPLRQPAADQAPDDSGFRIEDARLDTPPASAAAGPASPSAASAADPVPRGAVDDEIAVDDSAPAHRALADVPAPSAPPPSPARPPPPYAPDAADDPSSPDTVVEPAPTPDFVRHADAKARWRQPGVRAALALTCVAATLGLSAQVAHEWRDTVAARWPASRGVLELLCREPCRIGAPRDIDALSVESSGLVRVEGTAMYQLQVLLRNRSPHPAAVPALDLTLSDTRGATVARRVLTPQEAGIDATALQPAADLPIQVTLATGGRAIAGYTIEIFYP